jgi:DNA sulfur modification protein DndD
MILRSIKLEDFGLYQGVTELNLIPRKTKNEPRPIVLIGGKNGAGKTTLLEAVRLALYGKRALGTRVGQVEYDNYLRGRINRAADQPTAAVALEFDYAEAGSTHRYSVRREWSAKGKGVVETLLLEKDGKPIADVPREEWHYFLQELIPPGVSQLFFFDGEKISQIAEGEEDNEQLADAVRGLLGIDLVSRLRVDLGLYLARHERTDESGTASRLEQVGREISSAEGRITDLLDQTADLSAQRDSQARVAEQVRRQFIAEGGDAAANRAKTEADLEEVRRAQARAEHEFRDLANKLLPFAMAPKLVTKFRAALKATGASEMAGDRDSLVDAVSAWRAEGLPKRSTAWSNAHWADLEKFLVTRVPSAVPALVSPALREVGDGAATLARLAELETIVRPRGVGLFAELEGLAKQAANLERAIERANTASAGAMLDDLRAADQRLGGTEAQLTARQEDVRLLRGQLVTLTRERTRLLDEQLGSAKAGGRAALAARTAQALAAYEQKLLSHKLAQLRGEFVRSFNYLARKATLVSDVKIDPNTFAVTLIDPLGNEVPKSALSAGEKQIYAIAMLWALARTSGRPLPMIIDTPLARLDSEHRAKLAERYFPEASHQVILLSTDTEVDQRMKLGLVPSISHTYRLDYDQDARRTTVSPGYFDDPADAAEAVYALQ